MSKILDECFKFDHSKGLINSKTKKKINITFKPTLRFDFDIHLVCVAKEKPTKEVETLKNSKD
jgi:ribosome-binding factor A